MPLKLKKQIYQLKNPNRQEVVQLAIYKYGQGFELESTEKQLQLSGQSGT